MLLIASIFSMMVAKPPNLISSYMYIQVDCEAETYIHVYTHIKLNYIFICCVYTHIKQYIAN